MTERRVRRTGKTRRAYAPSLCRVSGFAMTTATPVDGRRTMHHVSRWKGEAGTKRPCFLVCVCVCECITH